MVVAGAPAVATPLAGDLGELTETAMRRAVDLHRGDLSAAARALNIDCSTLYRRLLWKGQRPDG